MDGRQRASGSGYFQKIISILLLKALRCVLDAFFIVNNSKKHIAESKYYDL